MELSLGNSSTKKFPLRCLTGLQVRKIVHGIDNKGTSKLTQEGHSQIGKTSKTAIFPKQSTTEICKLFRKELHHSCSIGTYGSIS